MEIPNSVGSVASGAGHLLSLCHLANGRNQIAIGSGLLKALGVGGLEHPGFEGGDEFAETSFQKGTQIRHGFGVALVSGEALDAGPLDTLDVVLEAGPGVKAS